MTSIYLALAKRREVSNPRAPTAANCNRQKVLVLSSRGVTFRHRHLMNDLNSMLPHSRRDTKLDTKTKLYQLNELADLYNCNNVFFFEARKGKDLYAWISKVPNGPTAKFHLQNLHTIEELHFPGNCLKGSRPILSFDVSFDEHPHLRVIKELLHHVFGVPKGARKTKPFVDHVMGFTVVDGKIWVRCYQINESESNKRSSPVETEEFTTDAKKGLDVQTNITISLTEIGPRFVMTPIIILESSFGGPVIYENRQFISPNQVRTNMRLSRANGHNRRSNQGANLNLKRAELGLNIWDGRRKSKDALEDSVVFA